MASSSSFSSSSSSAASAASSSSSSCSSSSTPVFSKMPAKLQIGNFSLSSKKVLAMTDSSALYHEGRFGELYDRLEEDGFVLIRQAISRETIEKARRKMLVNVQRKGGLQEGTDLMSAEIAVCSNPKSSLRKCTAGMSMMSTMSSSKSAAPMRKVSSMTVSSKDAAQRVEGKKLKMDFEEGWTIDAESGGVVGDRDEEYDSWREVGNSADVVNVYNGPDLHRVFENIFSAGRSASKYEQARALSSNGKYKTQPNCTWLRVKGRGEMTVEHADYYYFKKNTSLFADNRKQDATRIIRKSICTTCNKFTKEHVLICTLCDRGYHASCQDCSSEFQGEWHCNQCGDAPLDAYTCWISLSNITWQHGALTMKAGTHRLSGYTKPPKDREVPSEYVKLSNKYKWQVTEYGPGDIVLFNIKTIHAASKNTTKQFRLSIDTRVMGSSLQLFTSSFSADEELRVPKEAALTQFLKVKSSAKSKASLKRKQQEDVVEKAQARKRNRVNGNQL